MVCEGNVRMRCVYDYLIVTHLPAFYKVNLYNCIAQKLNIYVIFIANGSEIRTQDFVDQKANFKFDILHSGSFEKRPIFFSILKIFKILLSLKYKKLILGGWDLPEFWFLAFTSPKSKNCVAVESTFHESTTKGVRGFVKRFFLTRVSRAYVSGKNHKKLVQSLGFNQDIITTHGVGIINKTSIAKDSSQLNSSSVRKKYLYLGRLSPEKNVSMLIDIFQTLPDHQLLVVGDGPLKKTLQKNASDNVKFIGYVENSSISKYFLEVDFLILPSKREPWGLVIEESLNLGVPVIVSTHCGGSELITDGVNGFVFDPDDSAFLRNLLIKITPEQMLFIRSNCQFYNSTERQISQVDAYCSVEQ